MNKFLNLILNLFVYWERKPVQYCQRLEEDEDSTCWESIDTGTTTVFADEDHGEYTVTSTQEEISGYYEYPPEPKVAFIENKGPVGYLVRAGVKLMHGFRPNNRQMGPFLRTMR